MALKLVDDQYGFTSVDRDGEIIASFAHKDDAERYIRYENYSSKDFTKDLVELGQQIKSPKGDIKKPKNRKRK